MKNKKLVTIIAGILAFVIAFGAGFLMSGGLSKNGSADNPDGQDQPTTKFDMSKEILGEGTVELPAQELRYYGMLIYNNLFSQSFQYDYYYGEGSGVSLTGFDWAKSPEEQSYPGEIEGKENPTYMDYIEYAAVGQLHAVKTYVEYAKVNGITLTDAELKEISDYIEEGKTNIESGGVSFAEYLTANYGEGFTEEIFETIITEQYLVNRVDLLKSEAYKEAYTEEDAQKWYDENLTSYGVVTMRNYVVAAEQVMNQDGTSGAVTDETMKEAEKKANDFVNALTDEKSFMNLAAQYEKAAGNEKYEEMKTQDSLTLIEDIAFEVLDYETSDEEFASWAFDTSRQKGDTYVALIDGVGYGVYMVIEPVHKVATEYSYDVRHIYIDPSKVDGDSHAEMMDTSKYGDVTIDIDVNLDQTVSYAAYMKAQDVLIEYLEGDMSEESFGELAKKYSADGNANAGGIYENVTPGQMVEEFESWAFEEGRQYGDVGIVETTYGYHVMYFISVNEVSSWSSMIIDDFVYQDIVDFSEDLLVRYPTQVTDENLQLMKDAVKDIAQISIEKAEGYFNMQQ